MAGPGPDAPDELAVAQDAYDRGDVAGALDLLPRVVAARPDDLAARLLLARCLADTAEPVVALAAAEAAVDIDRTSWQAQVLVARAARTVDPATARRAAETAAHLAPAEPEVAAIRAALAEDDAPKGRSANRSERLLPPTSVDRGVGRAIDVAGAPHGTDADAGELDEMAARVLARARAAEERAPADGAAGSETPPEPKGASHPMGPSAPTLAKPSLDQDPDGPARPRPAPAPSSFDAGTATGTGPRSDGRSRSALGNGIGTGPRPEGRSGSALGTADDDADDAERKPLGRQPLVLAGMACWLYVAFRYGVQVIGGPVGIAGFLLVVAAIGVYVRARLRATP